MHILLPRSSDRAVAMHILLSNCVLRWQQHQPAEMHILLASFRRLRERRLVIDTLPDLFVPCLYITSFAVMHILRLLAVRHLRILRLLAVMHILRR